MAGENEIENEHDSGSGAGPFDAMDPETARHPQPAYRMMREHAPVLRAEGAGVVVSRRADVEQVLRDSAVFSSSMSAVDLQNIRPLIPLQIDPPDHKKFRKVLDPLFAPQRMAELEQPAARLVNELIDGFVDGGVAGGVAGGVVIDFTTQFSVPFPSQVFLTLLGLPLDDLPLFLGMKDGIIRPNHVVGTPFGHPDAVAYQARTARSIYDYFDSMLEERTSQPQDDLLSHFLDTEVDGARLTREDILDICFLFLIAGLDTVSAALDCFFAYLAEHPEQRARIVDDPSIIPHVVEELLRWETPVVGVARVATQDTEVGGCPISAGEHVMPLLGSANTDEAEWVDGDDVRWDRAANRHLAFGGGIHRCLGSHLARLELRVALREWHARIPHYRAAPGADLRFTAGIRSLDAFPMVLHVSA